VAVAQIQGMLGEAVRQHRDGHLELGSLRRQFDVIECLGVLASHGRSVSGLASTARAAEAERLHDAGSL
jgi:hypothetical protein